VRYGSAGVDPLYGRIAARPGASAPLREGELRARGVGQRTGRFAIRNALNTSPQRRKEYIMTALGQEIAEKESGSVFLKDDETKNIIDCNHRMEGGLSNWPFARNLLRFLSELMDLTAFEKLLALRVWLYPPKNRAVQVDLLMANLPSKLKAGIEIPLNDTVTAWLWQHQRPLIIAAKEDVRFPDFARLLLERHIHYFCAVPLIVADRRIGVLGLASTRREAFTSLDIEFIRRGMANIGDITKNNGTVHHAPETHKDSHREETFP
jgi:GAF domain-containing protein